MLDLHFFEFVKKCQLADWEKNELEKLPVLDRNKYYIDHLYWPRLAEARQMVRDANVYLMKNGIFLQPEIKERFIKLAEMIWEAVSEDEVHHQYTEMRPQQRTHRDLLRNEGEPLLKKLESKVYKRLWGDTEVKDSERQ